MTRKNKDKYGSRHSSEKLRNTWRNSILYHEELLLGKLNYDLEIITPDDYLSKLFKKQKFDTYVDEKVIMWTRAIINDSFHGDFCVRYNPIDIAAAAISTASNWLKITIDNELFREAKVDVSIMLKISKKMNVMYKEFEKFIVKS